MDKIVLKIFKKIEEISANAGGPIAMSAQAPKLKRKKDNMKKQNIVNRYKEGLKVQEGILRKYIRGNVKKMLNELSDNELTSSTGTNLAAKSLEKFVKTLPTQYKALASSKEQRLSYAAHYTQVIKDVLVSALSAKGINLSTVPEPVGLEAGGEAEAEQFAVTQAEPQMEEPAEEEEVMFEQEEVGDIAPADDEMIAATPEEEKEKENQEIPQVQIPGEEQPMPKIAGLDETGREQAATDVKVAIAAVKDGINTLSDVTDVKDYISTVITQIKIRFNRAERELTGTDATKIKDTAVSSAEDYMNQLEEAIRKTVREHV